MAWPYIKPALPVILNCFWFCIISYYRHILYTKIL